MMLRGKARAYTNIALIKYWGKKDKALILPMNNSLSLTLDAFYTETSVAFDETLTDDVFFLDGVIQDEQTTKKVTHVLQLARDIAGVTTKACVKSYNFVPTAAGLASSASGFAALAGACNLALNLGLSNQAVSCLARRGSGSACRSIYGGFVEWEKGEDDLTSVAQQVPSNNFENELAMLFILVNDKQKDVSSRAGMEHTVQTSVYYDAWLAATATDLVAIKQAIFEQDFTKLGEIMEANGLRMHATTLAAFPPFSYWSPDSLRAMDTVRRLRKHGLECYFTMDAGPNVKVLCQKKDEQAILQALQLEFSAKQVVLAHVGRGLEYLEMDVNV